MLLHRFIEVKTSTVHVENVEAAFKIYKLKQHCKLEKVCFTIYKYAGSLSEKSGDERTTLFY